MAAELRRQIAKATHNLVARALAVRGGQQNLGVWESSGTPPLLREASREPLGTSLSRWDRIQPSRWCKVMAGGTVHFPSARAARPRCEFRLRMLPRPVWGSSGP